MPEVVPPGRVGAEEVEVALRAEGDLGLLGDTKAVSHPDARADDGGGPEDRRRAGVEHEVRAGGARVADVGADAALWARSRSGCRTRRCRRDPRRREGRHRSGGGCASGTWRLRRPRLRCRTRRSRWPPSGTLAPSPRASTTMQRRRALRARRKNVGSHGGSVGCTADAVTTRSTRRFCRRPSSVALEPMGRYSA